MIQQGFEQIGKPDIDALIANAVAEGKAIDYKESLSVGTDGEKKEFLKDISSFANASGGDILYGVREKRDAAGKPTGLPDEARGLAGINVDQEKLRLDNLIRNGIAPRIGGLQIKGVEGFPDGPVLLIRVPKSWAAPHMLTFQSESRFFSRTNSGRHALDVTEIRSAFALSANLPERIRQFRDSRLGHILAGETPVSLKSNPKSVLHLLPPTSFDRSTHIDLATSAQRMSQIQTIHTNGLSSRYNFDGVLAAFGDKEDEPRYGYLQVFRNGAIEAVDAITFELWNEQRVFSSFEFEKYLIEAVDKYLQLQKAIGLEPPIVLMLSLLGVKGHTLQSNIWRRIFPKPIDRDDLLLPDVLIEDYSASAASILQPVFDAVWQASGLPRCLNYDDKGQWIGKS